MRTAARSARDLTQRPVPPRRRRPRRRPRAVRFSFFHQIALDTANGFYRNARVRLVDLRVERLAAEFAPEVSQQGDWAKTSEARWRQAAAPFLGKGRLVAVLAQTRSVNGGAYIEGKLLGPHPLNQTGVADGVPPLLWVNVDPDDTQTAPFFSTFTLIHELGHRFGLLHTFETRFGCELGDIIEDTGPASNRLGECSEGGLDACRTQRDSVSNKNRVGHLIVVVVIVVLLLLLLLPVGLLQLHVLWTLSSRNAIHGRF